MNQEKNTTEINRLLKKKEFDALYNLFVENNLSSDKLLTFYLQNKNTLFSSGKFWNSHLPHFHLSEIINSSVKVDFINSYFLKGNNCNCTLNECLVLIAKDEFIRFFKLFGAFNHADFLSSLKQLSEINHELQKVVKEFEIILTVQEHLQKEAEKDEQFFLQFPFGEIALALTQYNDGFKNQPENIGYRNRQISYEMTLVEELNKLFHLFKGKPKMTFENPTHQFNPEVIFPFIKRLIKRTIQRNIIELYQSSYLNFQSTVIITPLKTNEHYSRFKLNDLKTEIEECYLCGFDLSSIINKKNISGAIKFWEFYNLPQIVEDVDCYKLLKFLRFYSIDIPIDKVFEYNQLSRDNAETFKWSTDEAQSILSYLTFDIHEEKYPKNWLEKPFIKEGDNVFWLGTFLKNRRWEVTLLNRLKKEQGNLLSENFEKRIEEIFKSKDFKTIRREKFRSSNGEQGDFDVLAFKDNHLFVCEAKTRTRSDRFSHAAETESLDLEGKAVHQLDKAIRNINENWANLREKLGIEDSVELNSVKTISLIVTDVFEGDSRLYKEINKISLLELDVILNNKKRELYATYCTIKSITDGNNPNFIFDEKITSIDYDLWNGQAECSVEKLIKNIQQNAVWEDLDKIWSFESEDVWLDYNLVDEMPKR
jgi:hypothetical protein